MSEQLLETFTTWARQVAAREDVPRGIRSAAAGLYADGKLALATPQSLPTGPVERAKCVYCGGIECGNGILKPCPYESGPVEVQEQPAGEAQIKAAAMSATEIAMRAALASARREIEWWVNEHSCCRGHEIGLLRQIDALLASPETPSVRGETQDTKDQP